MELSSLAGLPVLTQAGERLGYVLCAYIGKDFALSSLLCSDDEEEEFSLPADALLSAADAALVLPRREAAPSGAPCPVARPAFDESGTFLGRVTAFETEGALLTLTGGRTLAAKDVSFSEAVIVHEAKRPIKRSKKKNPTRAAKTERKTLPEELGQRALSCQSDLLGKKVKKAVYCKEELLAESGETITPATLHRARAHNCLLELAANTLTQ